MSKCLEICKEIWRSLSLVWWNFSQVWSQKLWFFDSAIFECLHNTWLTFTRPSNYIISYHTFRGWKDSPKNSFFVDSEQNWHCLIFVKNVVKSTSHHSKWCEIPFWWNCWVSFCENVYNVRIELEVRRLKK